MRTRQPRQPPTWWGLGLYKDIIESSSREVWAWEFMRRAKLLEVMEERPVDAMNPEPNIDNLNPDFISYYKQWDDNIWFNKNGERIGPLLRLPSVFRPDKFWSDIHKGQQYRVEDYVIRQFVDIRIDISRRKETITHEFEELLSELRREFSVSEPDEKRFTISAWQKNYLLQIWDLNQFDLTFEEIATRINRDLDLEPVITANRVSETNERAVDLINNHVWFELIRKIK